MSAYFYTCQTLFFCLSFFCYSGRQCCSGEAMLLGGVKSINTSMKKKMRRIT
ncbi:MAG: hypothetical protein KBC30_07965 [Planctomycetes bacterium]|nr:hypothetical protein [Planctomycetota bacterium]HPY74534.1 hypothetical protein [Planctomycetota bacterium]